MADQRELLVRKMIEEGTSDDDIRATLRVFDAQPQPQEGGGVLSTIKDFAIGAAKGLGSTVAGIGELAGNAGMLPGVQPSAFQSQMRHPAFAKAEEATTASNGAQRAGKVVEQVAEMAVPVGGALNAVPRMARAGKNFQKVMSTAKGVTLNVEGPGQVALRIQQLAERGGTEPRAVGKLLRRMTDPERGPMNYEEGRDFYSNISRLSANERQSISPVIQRELGNLRESLNSSLQDAAGTVGQGDRYAGAMKEYARAAKLRSYKDTLIDALKRGALPTAGAGLGGAAAYWLGSKARQALGGENE